MNWISATKLPEKHKDVLIWVLQYDRYQDKWWGEPAIGSHNGQQWEITEAPGYEYPVNYYEGKCKVSHWQELPQPPKE